MSAEVANIDVGPNRFQSTITKMMVHFKPEEEDSFCRQTQQQQPQPSVRVGVHQPSLTINTASVATANSVSEFYRKPYANCKMCLTSQFKCKVCLEELVLKLKTFEIKKSKKPPLPADRIMGIANSKSSSHAAAIQNESNIRKREAWLNSVQTQKNTKQIAIRHSQNQLQSIQDQQQDKGTQSNRPSIAKLSRRRKISSKNYLYDIPLHNVQQKAQKVDSEVSSDRNKSFQSSKEKRQGATVGPASVGIPRGTLHLRPIPFIRQTLLELNADVSIANNNNNTKPALSLASPVPEVPSKRYRSVFNINKIQEDSKKQDETSEYFNRKTILSQHCSTTAHLGSIGRSVGATKLSIQTIQPPLDEHLMRQQQHIFSSQKGNNYKKQKHMVIKKNVSRDQEEFYNNMLPVIRQLSIQDKTKIQRSQYRSTRISLKKPCGESKPVATGDLRELDMGVKGWEFQNNNNGDQLNLGLQ